MNRCQPGSQVDYDDGPEEALARLALGDDISEPGPIVNDPLLVTVDGERLLREGLVEKDDYALVPAKAWALLEAWRGSGADAYLRWMCVFCSEAPLVASSTSLSCMSPRRASGEDWISPRLARRRRGGASRFDPRHR